MADGDPINIVSEELLSNCGFETFSSGLATSWTKNDSGGAISITSSDNSNQRSGSYCQKLNIDTTDYAASLYQVFTLPGRADNISKNKGLVVAASVYAKGSTGTYVKIKITELSAGDVAGSTGTGSAVTLTSSYQQASLSYTITDTTCAKLKVEILLKASAEGKIIYLDDASLMVNYSVSTNPTEIKYSPTLPEQSATSINNTYYRQRNVSTALKYRDIVFTFGICDSTQKNILFQLTQWDKSFIITPYNPDLPATLVVKFKPMKQAQPLGKRWNKWSCTLEFNEI